jgi:hypothetical protein
MAVDMAQAGGRAQIGLRVALLRVDEVGKRYGSTPCYASRAAIQGDRKDRRAVTIEEDENGSQGGIRIGSGESYSRGSSTSGNVSVG